MFDHIVRLALKRLNKNKFFEGGLNQNLFADNSKNILETPEFDLGDYQDVHLNT